MDIQEALSSKKDDPSLDLGLYIAFEIMKRHGGRIWQSGTEDEESVFYFTLPL